jgi:hypothetical protein
LGEADLLAHNDKKKVAVTPVAAKPKVKA